MLAHSLKASLAALFLKITNYNTSRKLMSYDNDKRKDCNGADMW